MSLKNFLMGGFTLAGISFSSFGATFPVTVNSDSGAGSLRQAISDANSTPGANLITFNIPGSGVHTISTFSALPSLTNSITIDGTTQPGYAGAPLIDLNGNSGSGRNGLIINTSNCVVRALILRNFGSSSSPGLASGILLTNAFGATIQGCYIGTTAAGSGSSGNSLDGIRVNNSAANTIGGTNSSQRNIISGNFQKGVFIFGAGSTGNQVMGNYIGPDVSGLVALGNGQNGILISNAANNVIGGAVVGAGNVISGNGYSGSTFDNLMIQGSNATGNVVAGNILGLKADFSVVTASPGFNNGVRVDNAPANTIGGTTAAARNYVGNNQFGILIINSNAVGNVIEGNYVGVSSNGTTAVPNHNGIFISTGASGTIVGAPGAGNLISGNQVTGLSFNASSNNTIQANFIGTDATGMLALDNGASGSGSGMSVTGSGNLIGGTVPGAGNVISGNPSDGLDIVVGSTADSVNNLVQGNLIGVAADGVSSLGNGLIGIGGRGVSILGASSNIIGGLISGSANVIANNGYDGVWLARTFGIVGAPGSNNLVLGNIIASNGAFSLVMGGTAAGVTLLGPNVISRNSIYGNVYLGIDRGGDGPTANTPGNAHNYPVITATRRGSTEGICTWDAAPNESCTMELYANAPCSGIGGCQAQTFLCSQEVMTDMNGHAEFTISCSADTSDGSMITCIATPSDGESTEICVPLYFPTISPVAANLSTSHANTDLAAAAHDPISTFTGELYESLPADLDLGGPLPFFFVRYYAAFLKKDGLIAGALGDNWLHNFEMTLTATASNTVNIVNNRGRLIQFTNSSGAFTLIGAPDIPFQLVSNAGDYILGDPRSQRLYTFDSTGKLIKIEDGHGNTHTLAYAAGKLTSVSDGLGRAFTFLYSGGGFLTNVSDGTRSVSFAQTGNNLTSSGDALGFVTTYGYDTLNANPGLMSAMTLPEGNARFTQTFDAQGRVLSQKAAGSNTTTLAYSNLVTTITDPLGRTNVHTHTATGEFSALTDETGLTLTLGNDANRRRTSVTDRLGQTTLIGYHAPSGKPAALTNADGTVTAFTYASRATNGITFYDLAQVSYPDGTSESFTYDAGGNVLTRTDRAGKVFTFTYNARGQALTAQNPLGGVTTFTYNADGTLATRADSDTGTTQFYYDGQRRMTNLVHPDSTALRAQFDANDRVVSVTDERNDTTTFTYDNDNRLIAAVDAAGKTNRLFFDSFNRVVRATDRLGNSSATSYDALDHVASVTNRNGNVTSFAYDTRQRLSAFTDPGGKAWGFGYDNEALLVSATNPLGQTDSQGLNPLGYAIAFTNALGQVASVARDSMQRTTNAVDEISRTNGFGYDARGLLGNTTAPLIGTATYQRNNLGLLSGITGLNGEQWNFAYTPMGRLQSLADPLNRMSAYSYDNRGRLQRIVFADGVVRSNSYDQASHPTRRQYSSGPDLQFTYDSLNRLASANDLSFAYDPEGRVTNTVSSGVNQGAAYDADGRLTSIACQNGAFTVNYTYDSRDRLTQVGDTLTGTQINFNYDDAGRLTSITRPNAVNGTYSYDAAGRLTRIQEGAIIDIQYGYDAAGEITNANFTAPLDPATLLAPAMPTFAYDAAHQIKNSGYAFDARGRQTASPGHSYQWDGAARLVGIDGVALAYNGANDIETRTTGGVTTRYFYNHALGLTPIMAERNENTLQIQRYYVWTPGGRLLYLIDAANGNAVRFFHYDRVGSTLALTSGAGAVTDAYAYSPYGVLLGHTGTSPQPFTYVGEFGVRGEAAANLYHMRARYYDPVSARFLSQDPLPPRLADNRSLDPYNYVMENPIRYTDPEGLKAVTIAYSEHIAGISSDGKYMLYGEVIHWSDGHFTESPLTSEIIGGPADAVAHVLSDEELNALRSPGSSASATVAVGTPPPLSAKGAAQATDREVDIDGSTEFWLLRGGGVAAGVPANPPPILFSIFHLPGAAPTTDANELICLPFNLIPVGGPIIGQRGFDPFGISGKFDYVSTQEGISTGENIPWEAMFPQRK